ncbi:MAG: Crp/Fnr family transcriptional regulator [Dysgonomonas sp.]
MDYYIYFVESGLIRSFISRDGREITLWIVPEGRTPVSSSKLTKQGISKVTIDAVTDCVLWRVSRSQLSSLAEESLSFANFTREMAENIILETEIFWTDYYGLEKKEQYRCLMKQYPGLFQRVSLG